MTYWRGTEGRLLNFLKIFSRILKSFWRFGSPWNFLNRSIYSLRYHFWTLWFGLSQKYIIHLILKSRGQYPILMIAPHVGQFWKRPHPPVTSVQGLKKRSWIRSHSSWGPSGRFKRLKVDGNSKINWTVQAAQVWTSGLSVWFKWPSNFSSKDRPLLSWAIH